MSTTGLLTLRSLNERLPHLVIDNVRWPVIVTDVVGVDDQGDLILNIVYPADNSNRYTRGSIGASLVSYAA